MSVDFGYDAGYEPGYAEREFFGAGFSETTVEPGFEPVGGGFEGLGGEVPCLQYATVLGRQCLPAGGPVECPPGTRPCTTCPPGMFCAQVINDCCPENQPPSGAEGCPSGYWRCDAGIVCTATQRIVRQGDCCTCEPLDSEGGEGGTRLQDPFQRIGDAITQFLAGGGGGISIPQLPQPQVVAAPVTRSTLSPVAVLLIVAGLAGAGWWVYTRTRRRAQ